MARSSVPLPIYLHEDQDKLTQDCKAIVSLLPKEKGWLQTHLYQYQGFWCPTRQLLGVLACQKLFQAQPTDLFLVTTPKSGTTWLKAMAFAVLNRESYPDPHASEHPLRSTNPHELVPFLENKLYIDGNIPDFTNWVSPRLFCSHMPYVSLPGSIKDLKCKIVYLCRNPRDTLTSLWHFVNKLRIKELGPLSLEEAFQRFCRGVSMHGPYWDHVLEYWKESLKNPEMVLFLKYEEIKESPKVHLRRIAEFLGFPFSPREEENGVVEEILKLCSFESLSSLEVNKEGKLASGEENEAFFRKGEVGDSLKYLTPEMLRQLDRITDEKFKNYGLKF